jgi:hypothetical protein
MCAHQAPGAITLSPVANALARSPRPASQCLLSTGVRGDNIGYAYLFAGYYDANGRSLYVADTDYLQSGADRSANGVYYPDWGEGDFTLEFEWEPLMFAIDDGQTTGADALLRPSSYGAASAANAVYTVDGTYTYADSGDGAARRAFTSAMERHPPGLRLYWRWLHRRAA